MNPFTKASSNVLRTVRRILPALKRRLAAPMPVGESMNETAWDTTVGQVVGHLETLSRVTEEDFLTVGGKLVEFRSVARRISSGMVALTELISGEHGRNASRALERMLERTRVMDARIERSCGAIESVRDDSSRTRLALAQFSKTVTVFRTLCTLTRIETSRLGSAGSGFGDLADEVKRLSEKIETSGEGALDASFQLEEGVQSALRGGSDLSTRQLRELHSLIASVVESLKSFEERQQRAQEAAMLQATQHAAVCDGIEDLAGSVQFHDITRQQIEHVIQSLLLVQSEVSKREEKCSVPPADAQFVISLQSSQLLNTGAVFSTSIGRMERDLDGIAARVRDMTEASRALTGLSGDEHSSFFLTMEARFNAILSAVNTCISAEASVQSTASELDENIRRMREAVQEIRGVETRIQRIALNATIQSAQIGAEGNALNVIAGVMRHVALDSHMNTEDVGKALDSMSDAAHRVSEGSVREISGDRADTDDVLNEMRKAITELHLSSKSAFDRVCEIGALGLQLSQEIQSLRNGLSAGPLFAQVIARARGDLERMAADAGPVPLIEGALASSQDLERFARHYTMQSERDVYESVVRGRLSAPPDPAAESIDRAEDGTLGDNIEIF